MKTSDLKSAHGDLATVLEARKVMALRLRGGQHGERKVIRLRVSDGQ